MLPDELYRIFKENRAVFLSHTNYHTTNYFINRNRYKIVRKNRFKAEAVRRTESTSDNHNKSWFEKLMPIIKQSFRTTFWKNKYFN